MVQVSRKDGITTIEMGRWTIKTDKINRHEYNRLRKLPVINRQQLATMLVHKYKLAPK